MISKNVHWNGLVRVDIFYGVVKNFMSYFTALQRRGKCRLRRPVAGGESRKPDSSVRKYFGVLQWGQTVITGECVRKAECCGGYL